MRIALAVRALFLFCIMYEVYMEKVQENWERLYDSEYAMPDCLKDLANADQNSNVDEIYNRVISSIGCNHQGVCYSQSVPVLKFLKYIALDSSSEPSRYLAFLIISDILSFEPEASDSRFDTDEKLRQALHAEMLDVEKEFRRILTDQKDSRRILTEIIHLLEDFSYSRDN